MVKFGVIGFLNFFPINYGWKKTQDGSDVLLHADYPVRLNKLLASEQLDISLISLLSYAEHSDRYLLLPDISISAAQRVKSVALFSKVPIQELQNQPVALPDTSATSQGLLKVLFKAYYGLEPVYSEHPPDLTRMLKENTAALLIGDAALKAFYDYRENSELYVYDLVTLWRQLTGFPMVFAVCAVRKDFAAQNAEKIKKVIQGIKEAKAYSREHHTKMLTEVIKLSGLPEDYVIEYMHDLSYDLQTDKIEGMTKYFQLLYRYGLLNKPVHKEFYSDL